MANSLVTNLNKRVAFKKETTAGTPVTVDRFAPLVDETMGGGPEIIPGAAVIAGRLMQDSTNIGYDKESYKGDVQLEVYDHSMGAIFELMLGAVSTTGAGPYTHTITPGEPLPSFTLQVGAPSSDATVRTKTYAGTKVESWEMKFEPGKIITLGLSCTAKSEATNTAAAAISYPSTLIPVYGKHAVVTLYGSTSYKVKSLSLKGDNKLSYDEERGLGSAQIVRPQVTQDIRDYTGDAMLDLDDFTLYNNFKAGTQGALSIVCTVGSNTLTFTQKIELKGETPKFQGKGRAEQPIKWMAVGATDAEAMTITLVNSDSTP